MGLLSFLFGGRPDPEVERLRKKSEEDVLLIPGRSVYHLSHGCFSGNGIDECVRVARKEAEQKGYRLCKKCERTYMPFYNGDPGLGVNE